MAGYSPLGEFEQMVLLAVLRLRKEAYGNLIVEAIEERTPRSVSRSALYITFDRLENKGYLESRLSDASDERGGRPRRYVQVTSKGVVALRQSRQSLPQHSSRPGRPASAAGKTAATGNSHPWAPFPSSSRVRPSVLPGPLLRCWPGRPRSGRGS